MAIGKVQKIVLCGGTDSTGAAFTNTNPDLEYLAKYVRCPGGGYSQTLDAYMINSDKATEIEALFEPFDYVYASGLWTIAFSMVVGLYAVSRSLGAVLGFIRRG